MPRPAPEKVYVVGDVLTIDVLVSETESGLDRRLTVEKNRNTHRHGALSAVP